MCDLFILRLACTGHQTDHLSAAHAKSRSSGIKTHQILGERTSLRLLSWQLTSLKDYLIHATAEKLDSKPQTLSSGPRGQKKWAPALSITSRGPISEPSEVESGAPRAMQLDRGLAFCLCAFSASPALLETFHYRTLTQHRAIPCTHRMALRPSETNPHKARAATCQDRQLMSFSPFSIIFWPCFFFPLSTRYTVCSVATLQTSRTIAWCF